MTWRRGALGHHTDTTRKSLSRGELLVSGKNKYELGKIAEGKKHRRVREADSGNYVQEPTSNHLRLAAPPLINHHNIDISFFAFIRPPRHATMRLLFGNESKEEEENMTGSNCGFFYVCRCVRKVLCCSICGCQTKVNQRGTRSFGRSRVGSAALDRDQQMVCLASLGAEHSHDVAFLMRVLKNRKHPY